MNPEDLLTDALHDRVTRTDYPSTPLSTVAGRAGGIRARRRRTTALAAAAAVAAVVVPGAVWLGRSPDSSPRPGQTLSSGPTSSPTDQASGPSVSALADLPRGSGPGIDYLQGDTYVTMNGDRITDAVFRSATTATPTRAGILASVPPAPGLLAQGGIAGTYLVSGAHHHYLGCGSDRFAMSTDGVQSAYWLADSCPVTRTVGGALYSGVNNTMGESGPGHVATPAGSQVAPVGIVQQGVVVDQATGRDETVRIVDPSGGWSPLTALAVAGGSDANHDVVSGQLAGDSHTGAVVAVSTGAVRWRAPGWRLGQFSTDGKYVLAQRLDASAGYAVFDAVTGSRVVELDRIGEHVRIRQIAWDVDDTLLAVASDGRRESIVRLDLHGGATRATAATPVTDGNDVYRLATRP